MMVRVVCVMVRVVCVIGEGGMCDWWRHCDW